MAEGTHTLGNFENALRDVRSNVLRMASLAEQNLENAVRGLLTRNGELCNEAIVEEEEVNQLERKIDHDSLEILMRYNPVASDLRSVISGMRISSNLERISDEARNIARRSRRVLKHPEIEEVIMIEPVYEMAMSIFRDAMRSFTEGDSDLGLSLYNRDEGLDDAHSAVIKDLSKRMDTEPSPMKVKPFLHLVFIVRSLERVGDLSVNIAEDGIFLETATDIRHLGHDEAAQRLKAH